MTQQADLPFGREKLPAANAPGPEREPLRVAGLFAGVGGIELGLSRAGHQTELLCEIDEAARAVLDFQFPDVPKHGDVQTLEDLPDVDLVTAGFPCQDLSQAGKVRGIHGAKSGLIGEVFRLLQHRRVPWLLIENVPFMLQLAKGEALEVIVSALEHLGYRWAYRVVDSRAFGLPQRRRRVYLVASLEDDPRDILFADQAEPPDPVSKDQWRSAACGFYWTEGLRGLGWAHDAVPTLKGGSTIGIPSAPAIVFPDGRVGKPQLRDAERLQGFEADWTRPAANVVRDSFRWKLVGNAVTVDVAEWIGRRFRNPGRYLPTSEAPLNRTRSWPMAAWNVDGERTRVAFDAWPVHMPSIPLEEFLREPPTPLSFKATRGFYSRATSPECGLRFPPGFLEVVKNHLDVVTA